MALTGGIVASRLSDNHRAVLAEGLRPLTRIAFGAVLVLSPFRAHMLLADRATAPIYPEYTNFLVFWADFFLVALLLLWGLSLLIEPRRIWLGPILVRWPLIGLIIAVWASVPLSVDPSLSLYNAFRLTLTVPLALYCANEIKSLAQVTPALAAMVIVQGFVGVGQVIGQESLGLSSLGEYRLTAEAPSASVIWTEGEPKLLRAYGLTDHPNILGGVLAMALLVLASALSLRRPLHPALLTPVFVLGALALFLSFSRSAALAMSAGLLVVFGLLAYRRDWTRLGVWLTACLGAALICATFLVPYAPYLWARANPGEQAQGSTEARSLNEREALAKATNEIFVDHPLIGVGMGTLPVAMRDAFPDFGFDYQPAHFVLLVAAAETGLFGAFFYGALLVTPWLLLFWRRRQLSADVIGLSGALLGLTIIGLFDYYTWSRAPGQVWAWAVLGLWLSAYRRMDREPSDA